VSVKRSRARESLLFVLSAATIAGFAAYLWLRDRQMRHSDPAHSADADASMFCLLATFASWVATCTAVLWSGSPGGWLPARFAAAAVVLAGAGFAAWLGLNFLLFFGQQGVLNVLGLILALWLFGGRDERQADGLR
jgi:hypothetical protein